MFAARGVSKQYGAVRALDAVDLDLNPGEVVALVGDNGAGKSTLIKVISGAVSADEGQLERDGEPVQINNPHQARSLGISTVYQDLALCENLDVIGNLFLGSERRRWSLLR
jgi:D-xylose transport system ATP-binding protein